MLRAGGLSVRDLKRTAHDAWTSTRGRCGGHRDRVRRGPARLRRRGGPVFAPTPAYDVWLLDDPAGAGPRWPWPGSVRLAPPPSSGLQGRPGATRNALAGDLDRPIGRRGAARRAGRAGRRPVRDSRAPPSTSRLPCWPVSAGAARDAVRCCCEDLVEAARREAELLGRHRAGALSTPGATLATSARPGARSSRPTPRRWPTAIEPLMPEPIDHMLAAGRPDRGRARAARPRAAAPDVGDGRRRVTWRRNGLPLLADSVRRALDLGWSSDELLRELTRRAAPQCHNPSPTWSRTSPDDTARSGSAPPRPTCAARTRASWTRLLADKRSASLRLRRLAPTVVAAQAEPAAVLGQLRELGLAPALESAGRFAAAGPDHRAAYSRLANRRARRSPTPRPRPPRCWTPSSDPCARATAAVAADASTQPASPARAWGRPTPPRPWPLFGKRPGPGPGLDRLRRRRRPTGPTRGRAAHHRGRPGAGLRRRRERGADLLDPPGHRRRPRGARRRDRECALAAGEGADDPGGARGGRAARPARRSSR